MKIQNGLDNMTRVAREGMHFAAVAEEKILKIIVPAGRTISMEAKGHTLTLVTDQELTIEHGKTLVMYDQTQRVTVQIENIEQDDDGNVSIQGTVLSVSPRN